MERRLASLARSPLAGRVLDALEKLDAPRPNHLRVLTYHRIDDPAGFEQQAAYLARRFSPVTAAQVLEACAGRAALPPAALLITFDDAYRNFAQVAWPILKRHGLPATLFVPTAYPDHPERVFWWDRLEWALAHTARRTPLDTPAGPLPLDRLAQRRAALRRLKRYLSGLPPAENRALVERLCADLLDGAAQPEPQGAVLGWDDLRRLAAEGVTLGAHTCTHPSLDRISPAEAVGEAAGSLQDLRRELGSALPIFAYPGGRFSQAVVEGLRRAGFALAFTTVRGTNVLPQADPLRLKRINIGGRSGLFELRARLLQASPLLDPFRSRGRRPPSKELLANVQ